MKKIPLVILLLMLVLNVLFAALDYSTVDPLSLPTYTGSLNNPSIRVVYEDADGKYILVEINGILYAFYM